MKKIIYFFGGLLILVVGAAVIVPMTINPNDYKAEIAKAVEEKSGYKLEITGDINLSVLPSVKASVEGVSVSVGAQKPFVKVKEIRAYMRLIPLLSGKVEVGEIKLVEPLVDLVQNGKTNNWTAKKPEKAKTEKQDNGGSSGSAKRELNIKSFSIVDGNVSFNNNGNAFRLSNLNLDAGLNNDDLKLKSFAAEIFGGRINANGKIKLGQNPSTQIKFDGKGFHLDQVVASLMRNKRIERGTADLSGDLRFSGMTPDAVIATLNGSGNLAATELKIKGFDVAALAKQLDNIKSPADLMPLVSSLRGDDQATKINSIAGDFAVKNGVVNLPGVKMEADYAEGEYSGVIDLPKSYMNTEAQFNLVHSDKKASPKIGLRITGAMNSPSISPDLTDLTKWAVAKYGDKIMEKVPEKYKEFFKGL